jgi:vacuolar fusion protein MON1
VDDDSASIRSFVPTVSAGDDLEAMLSEMLGTDARWRLEQDDDINIWEGQSDGESETDSSSDDDPNDDGLYRLNGLMVEDKMIRWRSKRKHFFVLSSAGKPIYSRHGDDSIISGYMGVIQAIISFFEDNGDTLRFLLNLFLTL